MAPATIKRPTAAVWDYYSVAYQPTGERTQAGFCLPLLLSFFINKKYIIATRTRWTYGCTITIIIIIIITRWAGQSPT